MARRIVMTGAIALLAGASLAGCRGFLRHPPQEPFPPDPPSRPSYGEERRHDPQFTVPKAHPHPKLDISCDPFAECGESRMEGRVQVVGVDATRDIENHLRADISLESQAKRPLDLAYRIRFFDASGCPLDGPGLIWRPLHLPARGTQTVTMVWKDQRADSFAIDFQDRTE